MTITPYYTKSTDRVSACESTLVLSPLSPASPTSSSLPVLAFAFALDFALALLAIISLTFH